MATTDNDEPTQVSPSLHQPPAAATTLSSHCKLSRKRREWLFLIVLIALPVLVSWLFYTAVVRSNPVRTLLSLRRVQHHHQPDHNSGTMASSSSSSSSSSYLFANTYVMDYYSDYKIEHLRHYGLRNIHQLEDSFIEIWFPAPLAWMARNLKRLFIPSHMHHYDDCNNENDDDNNDIDDNSTSSSSSSSSSSKKDSTNEHHHCSTVTLNSGEAVYFGRNFDWDHDATLILRVHASKHKRNLNIGSSGSSSDSSSDDDDLASIAVIDLHYLNLNRPHIEQIPLWQRIPLLFAPYYVMDGMNRHGVAISDMTVPEPAHPPQHNNSEAAAAADDDDDKPNNHNHHHHHNIKKKPDIIHSTLARIILDYATSTEEAVKLMHEFQIHFPYADIHFMVADASGDSRIVEFIQGNIRVSSTNLSWHVSTNNIVWNKTEQEKDESCYRYEKGSGLAEQLMLDDSKNKSSSSSTRSSSSSRRIDENDAMHVTRSMAVDGWTMWTSIYELKRGEFWHFYKTRPDVVYRDTLSRETTINNMPTNRTRK